VGMWSKEANRKFPAEKSAPRPRAVERVHPVEHFRVFIWERSVDIHQPSPQKQIVSVSRWEEEKLFFFFFGKQLGGDFAVFIRLFSSVREAMKWKKSLRIFSAFARLSSRWEKWPILEEPSLPNRHGMTESET